MLTVSHFFDIIYTHSSDFHIIKYYVILLCVVLVFLKIFYATNVTLLLSLLFKCILLHSCMQFLFSFAMCAANCNLIIIMTPFPHFREGRFH